MAEQLRIAVLSVHSCPIGQLGGRDTGGMNVYIREMAAALARWGYLIDVYTRAHDPRDAQWEYLAPGARLIHITAGAVEEMGKLTQYNHLREFHDNLEAFRIADGASYDLVHSHYWLSGEVGLRLAQEWNVPQIFGFHTIGAAKDELGLGENEPAIRLITETEIATGCQHLTAGTQKEKDTILRHHGCDESKISVVPCGVDPDLFRPIDRRQARMTLGFHDKPLVLFVGRLDKLKGIDQLIEAMSLVEVPDCRLVVIGGDEYSRAALERLKTLADILRISDRVEFIGAVPQRELPWYYASADVVAVPSYSETFGMVALEAVSSGTPVVSTDVGAASLIIKEGFSGSVVSGNEPSALAPALTKWLENCNTDKNKLHDSVTGFGWNAVAERMENVYRHVLSKTAAGVE
ncbi:glycosyltransferase [Dehalogenimonas etheniformans]|uniref:Glycosyltransferase family 1 protein n=1 Tax=Dehalogenimonas etheniformans TaxID=1536648 RepID=A0A2P5P8S1_9CHLR|nr:glycosyltransferase [Dehalogenimonas etheniformans]PPD58702.1 glycosyltransferase family 1 protein [Dehalogenimonas etheniformans]QNT76531.1 glycosyltransferase [Dehalogenimonas etheniformans]